MNKHIENKVPSCPTCQKYQMANPREQMLPHQNLKLRWQTVATDLFSFDNMDFVLVVDYYSRYFEFKRLRNTKAMTVIHKMKAIFAKRGIPQEVISDNGPQYSSQESSQFSQQWGFNHTTCNPYPQANGLAEKSVQTAKRLLRKTQKEGKDPYISILEYRNTPIDGIGSPAQLLMNRRLRSILPSTPKQLEPTLLDHVQIRKTLQRKQ